MTEDDGDIVGPDRSGLALIVAMGRDRAIGQDGGLPWDVPEDMAFFRQTTRDHVIIMGSTTWASIGRALPRRQIIVVTSRSLSLPPTVESARDPDAALARALDVDPSPLVAGGSRLYEAMLPSVVRIYRTDLDIEVPGADSFFPALDPASWQTVRSWPGDDERVRFTVLDRVP